MDLDVDKAEWLETDELGGFASGTVSGVRTRRYHALLSAQARLSTGFGARYVLVNGMEVCVQTGAGTYFLSSQKYAPDVRYPDGVRRIDHFTADPWPRWIYWLEDGTRLEHELFVHRESGIVVAAWRLLTPVDGVLLTVHPFFSGRRDHALHLKNPDFQFDAERQGPILVWRPYPGVPGIAVRCDAQYSPEPTWYRQFLYDEEKARGLDFIEDLASPGTLRWDLSKQPAELLMSAVFDPAGPIAGPFSTEGLAALLRREEEDRRRKFPSRLHKSADAYLVRRGGGRTITAGYPWFMDWGRDTFIALRGICLATGRLQEALDILLEWCRMVSQGMLPNRFSEEDGQPAYSSVDASLWFIVAVDGLRNAAKARRWTIEPRRLEALMEASEEILKSYLRGTRFGIGMDSDGLLAAGEGETPLTWMDAKVDGRAVTPRIGKPVEVQALWINALWMIGHSDKTWKILLDRAMESFRERFWNEDRRCLYDVVDADHRAGVNDPVLRPNQIFAAGGLPLMVLPKERSRQVVDAVEKHLFTPMGLRSLARGEPGYCEHYEGDPVQRDKAYHQGTAWPWLLGPFVEAWVRVRGDTPEARQAARRRFLEPALRQLGEAGLGHMSEIADAEFPYLPRGCPFQAWSVGELLRLDQVLLAPKEEAVIPASEIMGSQEP